MRCLPILLLLLLCMTASARLPAVGDHVQIETSWGLCGMELAGNITDIDDNMICLNCTYSFQRTGATLQTAERMNMKPFDVCIGKGSIISMTWSHWP